MGNGKSSPRAVHYAWIVLAVTFVTLLATAGLRSVPGIIIPSLEREFGWSRESITFAVSVNLLLFGLAGPFLGRWMDLYGPRVVMLTTAGLTSLGALATLFMHATWQMTLCWGVIMGAGSAGCSMVMGSAVVSRWFIARRGLALGILGAAMSAGQLIFTPILMHLDMTYGWRSTTLFVALMTGVVALPLILLLMRDTPASLGLGPLGDEPSAEKLPKPDRHPMKHALRTREFWLLASSFGICGLTTSGLLQTHLIPHGLEHGFSEMTMAASLGMMGAADIIGTIGSGWICDRFGKRGPLAIYYLLRGASLLLLPFIEQSEMLMAFSVFYGLNWLSTVPATSALTADFFGKQNVGVVFGWIFCAHQVGAAIAAYGASFIHTWMGNYSPVFMAAGAFAIIATGLVWGIPRKSLSLVRA
ncbi:MFS transporter [Methyloterricola oryzae]|uniref:MFS transporter n=1 Tax=Methyloterricola oryzae TaxID=1495050 RepID=UPI0005EB06C7|nr:MFS transporter [Methyloterricola oryzae]